MMTTQILSEVRQLEPTKNLDERTPEKERETLSQITTLNNHPAWEDVLGLGWLFSDDWR